MSESSSAQSLSSVAPEVLPFLDRQTNTFSYVVRDPDSDSCAVIDSVLTFDYHSGTASYEGADAIINHIARNGLSLEWIIETHAHADHLSAAQYLKNELGGKVAIGEGITRVQAHFGPLFNLGPPFAADGHQFDQLFADGDEFDLGGTRIRVMHTPGHTNDSVTYLIGNAAFVGDTVFMTDYGTARCDFPGGDAGLLYDSIQKLFALPDDTVFYLCHDYPPDTRELCFSTPVTDQRATNIHVGGGRSRDDFIELRTSRDEQLNLPALILPSIQVNIQAGHLPDAEDNGTAYVRIPIDTI